MTAEQQGRSARVLVLDDERDAAELMGEVLKMAGHEPFIASSAAEALSALEGSEYDVLLTDIHLGETSGLEVCRRAMEQKPNLPVVVVTGNTTLESAVAAMRAGAHDFVTKPIDSDLLLLTIQRALKHGDLSNEVNRLRKSLAETSSSIEGLLGKSAAMRQVLDLVRRVAPTHATVLVTGESGTGKELVARAVHAESTRGDGPFVAINCAAVPAPLLESELFGHVRGAFTDARSSRRGLFLEATSGTVFLDEIGEMPLEMQVKLLRALQERKVRPVGGNEEIPFDSRIIAATNRNLEEEVAQGHFREDLYYRINVVGINVPPLRDRPGDISVLAAHFVQRCAERSGTQVEGISPQALEKLLAYDWPGNVRELENCIERAVALASSSTVTADSLPARIRSFRPEQLSVVPETVEQLIPLGELERRYIIHVLKLVGGNKSKAARILGMDRRTLYRRFEQFEKDGRTTAAPPPAANGERLPRMSAPAVPSVPN
jgi:two-component system, NtrC family, response regulator HydG